MEAKLNNFIFNRLNDIIGHYDIDDDGKFIINEINKKKVFKEFEISVELTPKNLRNYIISSENKDIGEIVKYHNTHIDIVPFFKDRTIYFNVRDAGYISFTWTVFLDNYYTCAEARKVIKDKIDNNTLKFIVNEKKRNYFESFFIKTKYFNYTGDIEWAL